jgi:hypothetical protein
MTRRIIALVAVTAAAGATLLAITLLALQGGVLLHDLALKQGSVSGIGSLEQLLTATSNIYLPYVVVDLMALALLILWMNRTYQGLVARDAPGLHGSPGGAVGWWFVPIANFYKPFQYLREMWRAVSTNLDRGNPTSRRQVGGEQIVNAFWALAVVSFVLGLIVRLSSGSLVTLDDFIRFRVTTVAFFGIRGLYWMLAIGLILMIDARFAKLPLNLTSASPPQAPS